MCLFWSVLCDFNTQSSHPCELLCVELNTDIWWDVKDLNLQCLTTPDLQSGAIPLCEHPDFGGAYENRTHVLNTSRKSFSIKSNHNAPCGEPQLRDSTIFNTSDLYPTFQYNIVHFLHSTFLQLIALSLYLRIFLSVYSCHYS